MRVRFWRRNAARDHRIAERIEQKQRLRGEHDQIRRTRERSYEPHNQNQGYGSGYGGGGS